MKPNYKIVAIDETGYFSLTRKDLTEVKKIWICYLVDFSQKTYCCEMTPSFWLEPISFFIEYNDIINNPRDSVEAQFNQDCIIEYWEDEVRKTLSDGSYMHCHILQDSFTMKIADYILPEKTLGEIENGNITNNDLLAGIYEDLSNNTPYIKDGRLIL